MKNYISEGMSIPVIADREITSGEPVIVGKLFGIPATSAHVGGSFELYLTGVYALRSDGSQFSAGDAVFFDKTPKKDTDHPEAREFYVVTSQKSENTVLIGVSAHDAAKADPSVRVRLNGITLP